MADKGKKNLLGVLVDVVDYDAAVAKIVAAARERRALAVAAGAVHLVMSGVLNRQHRYRLNHIDLVVPDGQPVRWALNLLHGTCLRDRVYGPALMLHLCERAASEKLAIYLYGSRPEVIQRLSASLSGRFPRLTIAGSQPSRFRRVSPEEKQEIASAIRASGASMVFVGLGCPRQETWIYEFRDLLPMPLVAVGAAFDFHAGMRRQAPAALQRVGLEWLFRLWHEPARLWRRYLLLNPLYVALVISQAIGLRRFNPKVEGGAPADLRFG